MASLDSGRVPRKRKRLFLSRAVPVVLALAVQIAFVYVVVTVVQRNFYAFYFLSVFVSIVITLWILSSSNNPAYKITWIVPILVFPLFGALFYLFWGSDRLARKMRRKLNAKTVHICEALPELQLPAPGEGGEIDTRMDGVSRHVSRYLHRYAKSPVWENTQTEYLALGELKLRRLLEELEKAERYIFMEYYIIEPGEMWNAILSVLERKAKAGVDVRVIYDDYGCMRTLPASFPKELREKGIQCAVFNPIRPVLSAYINSRDHRKITVIDGIAAFTGGINLADEYINRVDKYGHWKDVSIFLLGDAAWSFTVMFLGMWEYLVGTKDTFSNYRPSAPLQPFPESTGFVQPFADRPMDGESVGENVYLSLIHRAEDYLYITTPYLIIGNELTVALSLAAKGGTDVRIITPHRGDNFFIHAATRAYYKQLVESGVKIYEYTPGFIHSKSFVADDSYAVVGTINMDFRSLYLHFECGVWLYKTDTVMEIKNDFLKTLEACGQITKETLADMPFLERFVGRIMRILSPLL
ncbi:MAG TPA: cardiolipin synthase [Treponema sp.]|nr:cardiolipin synthase [Treponema sp.]